MFKGKTLLITGGTGSFGSATLNRFLKTDISEIRIFSRDEKKQHDMRIWSSDDRVKFYLGDVRDRDSVANAMNHVDYVFHAAALKQVPSCEFYPMEAIKTNVVGTDNVLSASVEKGVKKVVVLSTDKAVYPVNTMGISKALLEKLMQAKARTFGRACPTLFCGTRYGNVMGSRGSVIPLFIQQIKSGQPLTITDPRMTRFLLSLDGAIDLVLFAFENSQPGDIFVQKAPACTIMDLAKAVKELFNSSAEINTIGVRNGEKMHETLLTSQELFRAQEYDRYYRVPLETSDIDYESYFTEGEEGASKIDDYTSENTQRLTVAEVKELLLTLDFVRDELKA